MWCRRRRNCERPDGCQQRVVTQRETIAPCQRSVPALSANAPCRRSVPSSRANAPCPRSVPAPRASVPRQRAAPALRAKHGALARLDQEQALDAAATKCVLDFIMRKRGQRGRIFDAALAAATQEVARERLASEQAPRQISMP